MTAVPLVLVLVLAFAATANGADPQGPAFGANRYSASIQEVCARADTDEYVASLVKGETLSVGVTAAEGSPLRVNLTLVGPSGTEFVPAAVVVKSDGRSLSLRDFAIPATGRWTVRVAGADGTQGAYDVAFAVGAAPQFKVKKASVKDGSDSVFEFEGLRGAVADVRVVWKGRTAPVVRAILDPQGFPLSGIKPVTRKNSLELKGLVLDRDDGTYELRLSSDGDTAVCDVSIRVRPTGRPAGRKAVVLSDSEAFLDPVNVPIRGIAGRTVRFTGGNFSTGAPPVVLFGSARAVVSVVPGGTALDVIPPAMLDGSTVAVTVIGSDGQSCVRERYFQYVPTLWILDLEDAAGRSVRAGALAGGTRLRLRGSGFESGQTVLFGTTAATLVSPAESESMWILTPAASGGAVSVVVQDAFGREVTAPFRFDYLLPPVITSVAATGGAFLDSVRVAQSGGATVTVSGANLTASDVVTLGGTSCIVTAATSSKLTLTTQATRAGAVDLVVLDTVGQSATLANALRVVGWTDATSLRSPGSSTIDDLAAGRGAVGDLDGDGLANDLVLVSAATAPGTRSAFTRLFLGAGGSLVDVTDTRLPAVRSDTAGVDDWKASVVALGQLDDNVATDILIGGEPVASGGTDPLEARLFANNGSGVFALDAIAPMVRSAPWSCTDDATGGEYPLFTPGGTNGGRVTALAIGDIDGDGAADIVIGTDHFRTGALHVPLALVTFDGDGATVGDAATDWNETGSTVDAPAIRIFANRRGKGGGYTDVSFTRLPGGEATPGTLPAYHVRDLKLADIDGDGDLDIVLTWDDPTSVTPFGLANLGSDAARVATRVLLNDGAGFFTDATAAWMPASAGNEFWQADRLVLADFDADGDADMVLIHRTSIDAYTGSATLTRSALRMLRNDGAGSGFVNVTATAVPSVPLAGTRDDNLRGTALAVLDFDGDGVLDIVVGGTSAMTASSGGVARSTRLLRGGANFKFANANAYLWAPATDTGEAGELLVAALAPGGANSLLLVTDTAPAQSAGSEKLRVFDWAK